MNTAKHPISTPITKIIDYARWAPSVHNTQPWRFTVNDSTISLFVEPTRVLGPGDPTHRELWISLGICFETLLQAAKGLGYKAMIESLQTDSTNGEVARIHFVSSPEIRSEPAILDIITKRHSYRGSMKRVTIPTSFVDACKKSTVDLPGISIAVTDDRKTIAQTADLTYKGMSLALSSPPFRHELADLINYNWSSSHAGMHGFVLNRGLLGSIWEKWSVNHGIATKKKAHADQQKILDASGLVFVLAEGDVPHFWFDTGRAYMRVALEITRSGLVQSTIAAPVEAASFHEDIEQSLHTTNRVQAMIRIGEATHLGARTSPRFTVDELLT